MKKSTKDQLEIPRTPTELLKWIESIFEEMKLSPEIFQDIAYIKQIKEELFPLALYANERYPNNSEILICPVIGNQPYDAHIKNRAGDIVETLEITMAMDGHQKDLQNIFFEMKKAEHKETQQNEPYIFTDAFCDPPLEGNKNKGYVCKEREPPKVFRGHELPDLQIKLIIECLKNKSKKKYTGVSLLVGYSGITIPSVDGEINRLKAAVYEFLDENVFTGVNKIVFVDTDTARFNRLVEIPIDSEV